jgi:RHS repeat-associated protein
MVVVSDRKVVQTGGTYLADLVSTTDYYAFGMQMADRSWNTEGYRYGMNGMEADNEVKGVGVSYSTEYRIYDSRLGRWLSTDPKIQPYESPYVGMNNSPNWRNDPKGDIAPIVIWALKKMGDVAIGVMTDIAVQLAAEKYFGNHGII